VINAHEEFSPPRLGLITEKQNENKAKVDKPGRKLTRICRDNDKKLRLRNLSPLLRWVWNSNKPSTKATAAFVKP